MTPLELYPCQLGCGKTWISEASCAAQRAIAAKLAGKVRRNVKSGMRQQDGPSGAGMALLQREECLSCPGCVALAAAWQIAPRVIPRDVREGQSKPRRKSWSAGSMRTAMLEERRLALLRERQAEQITR